MDHPTPTRWQAHRLADPPTAFRRLGRLFDLRIDPGDPLVERLRDGLVRADPVADDFVAWAAARPGLGRELFERAVRGGLPAVPDAPSELVRWFEPLEREPAWLDRDLLEVGCRTSWRAGAAGGTVLTAMALMGGYRSSAAVKPLAMTGALDAMVVRRIAETSRFVLDVIESKTLPRFGAGFQSACRVRLMHAMVRRSLLRRADWDTAAWGVPINQTDMAATQLEFSAIYLTGLTLLGFRFTPRERAGVMHLWRYVGTVMGVDDALMAHDYRQGLQHMVIQSLSNPSADEDSRALARALHHLPERVAATPAQLVLARVLTRYRTAVSRLTLGDAAVDDIGLPAAPLHKLVLVGSAARFGLETLRRVVPGAHGLAERHGLRVQQTIIRDLVGPERVDYVPYAERVRPVATAA